MSSRGETSLKDMKYVPGGLKWMLIISGVLIALGAINVFSATYYMNIEAGVSAYSHILRHLFFLAVSLGFGVIIARCPYSVIRHGAPLWLFVTVVLLALVMVAGRTVNGATRWIALGGVSLQPSEIAKVTGLIWTASYLAKRIDRGDSINFLGHFLRPFVLFFSRKKKNSFRTMLAYFVPIYGPLIMALLVLKQPDMGTAGMILAFPVLLYVLAGLPVFEILLGACVAVVGFFLLAALEPYRWERIMVLFHPEQYAQSEGYQTMQSLIAVGSGGFLGQSFGEGMAKFLYLPEQYTDFAYAVFAQEAGFIGAVTVLALFVCFLFCGFSVARKLKDTYAALLVYGLTMLISMQGILNMAMVLGCFPVTGVPLPFISFGGTSLLTNITALALIWGTSVQCLKKSDMAERRKRIDAMEGRVPIGGYWPKEGY